MVTSPKTFSRIREKMGMALLLLKRANGTLKNREKINERACQIFECDYSKYCVLFKRSL